MTKKYKKGQGLLEVMIAVYIIIIGLLSIINLVVFNIQVERFNNNMLIASNLAREGIEAIRNYRDSNWLFEGKSWADNLIVIHNPNIANTTPVKSFYIATNYLNGDGYFYSIVYTGLSLEQCMSNQFSSIDSVCKIAMVNSNDRSYYDVLANFPEATNAGFYRIILINEICLDSTSPRTESIITTYNQHCPAKNPLIGLQVISKVAWRNGSKIEKVEIEDRLYNWK